MSEELSRQFDSFAHTYSTLSNEPPSNEPSSSLFNIKDSPYKYLYAIAVAALVVIILYFIKPSFMMRKDKTPPEICWYRMAIAFVVIALVMSAILYFYSSSSMKGKLF